MICASCGAANEPGRKFCGECGTRLAVACAACGAANTPGTKFCGECGTALAAAEGHAVTGRTAGPGARDGTTAAERRFVSVLFADLVGFTSLAEARDAEEVRELLTRYFDLARQVVGRYGGTVEKFIGDAVMAVWGAPTAREDDAERAVRAGLELLETVAALGRELGLDLSARAGVVTGEAAVTVGAVDQGMVAGDIVNTASRLQSAAAPGSVLVAETTMRAASRAVAFEPAGEQTLKGKALPVAAWRALRVVAQRGGLGRSELVEPPFVGREEPLRQLKELFHATGREGRTRLVSVVGQAGIGKSRLAWEFLKYIDGLVEPVYWHQGRSPAYGDGVAFWPLGEMVRRRSGIAENDDAQTTTGKLRATLEEFVADEGERRWIGPRLEALLGLTELPEGERQDLFAAWRTFFERVSEQGTTVLVFEDLHWADPGLLDFVEHLLEWARARPILVLTLARPELEERHAGWGTGLRDYTRLHLEPLPSAIMAQLLEGIVPGLPAALRERIVQRSEGVPLYAVETVRHLLAEGSLIEDGGAYRLAGEVGDLAVPETLQALIAARLDTLQPSERALVQDAAVLGQSFTLEALSALSGMPPDGLEPRLRALARREVLALDVDPRSPERGQYGFVQGLIREVAYQTLARKDRRARHLAAARYFESLGDDELAGVLASHYMDAFRATPPGPEADALATQARLALRGAAERAAALYSHAQALSYLAQALEVTADPAERAVLLQRAAESAHAAGRFDEAERLLAELLEDLRRRSDPASRSRATALLARLKLDVSRVDQAIDLLEAMVGRSPSTTESSLLEATAQLARGYLLADRMDEALATSDAALARAEADEQLAVLADVLITKGTVLGVRGRIREGVALLRGALELAQAPGMGASLVRGLGNLGYLLAVDDVAAARDVIVDGLEQSRRFGFAVEVGYFLSNLQELQFEAGDWVALFAEHDAEMGRGSDEAMLALIRCHVLALRGEFAAAEEEERRAQRGLAGTTEPQRLAAQHLRSGWLWLSRGRLDEATAAAMASAGEGEFSAIAGHRLLTHVAVRARDGRLAAEAWQAASGHRPAGRVHRAMRATIEAASQALTGDDEARSLYRDAVRRWREVGMPLELGLCLAEWSVTLPRDPGATEAADEARAIFERLGARALIEWLDREVRASPAGDAAGTWEPIARVEEPAAG
ncbi:MAG TPA: adenylate/guanylate cyclase domain-containing protein [Candidatus Limnocylindrales bacterium]|nr:adenylate/guanylate cyclase domain-containing protein [Candidatus Limnocylindrales bacterium]